MSAKKIISLWDEASDSEELTDRLEILKHKLKFLEQQPSVAFVEELSPIKETSQLRADVLNLAGSKPIPSISHLDELSEANPDILLFSLQGYSIQQMLSQMAIVLGTVTWKDLRAVRSGKVYLLNTEYLDESITTRVILAEILAEILHPKQFNFGYEGSGWINYIA